MKRVVICSAILLIIIVYCISMLFVLKNYNEQLLTRIDNILLLWENEDTNKTHDEVEELNKFWKKYYITISYIVQTDKIEHINTSIAKLKPLLECGNDEFYAECENIKYAINIIYENEFPKLHSLI